MWYTVGNVIVNVNEKIKSITIEPKINKAGVVTESAQLAANHKAVKLAAKLNEAEHRIACLRKDLVAYIRKLRTGK